MIKRFKKLLGRYRNLDQIHIVPYRSYGTYSHLYVFGRVLDNEPLNIVKEQSIFRTIKNTYKQFDSFEIPDAEMELVVPGKVNLRTTTSDEGYFLFDKTFDENLSEYASNEGWIDYEVRYCEKVEPRTGELENPKRGEFLIPQHDAEFGVISDIDDTILHTGVTSFLKWRLLKNSLLTNAYKRIPLKGAPSLYKKLHEGTSGKFRNPMFYLSNSPWNMYEYLKLFLDHNNFPKGPMLLRDLRTPFESTMKPEKPHKQKEITNILKTYPDLKFILIGDSGEHDASIYTDIAAQYSDRILAIYLRSVKHKKQMQRVQSIIDNFDTVPVLMVMSSEEAEEHARENGFIK
ncbi:App1 family protein [uncultured Christiangramia sp.]|uniref:App1 family protein n=1 Tax=uncultured Christiangramia sp. TaxID=503836 RepID=UPI002608A051|nr:phosphatase domain-containing protein [uncultured Christiangramia sp.]